MNTGSLNAALTGAACSPTATHWLDDTRVAMKEARHIYEKEKSVSFADDAMAALQGADALIIMTEWKAFRSPDFDRLKQILKTPLIFDGRNLYDPGMVGRFGFAYYAIGRGRTTTPG